MIARYTCHYIIIVQSIVRLRRRKNDGIVNGCIVNWQFCCDSHNARILRQYLGSARTRLMIRVVTGATNNTLKGAMQTPQYKLIRVVGCENSNIQKWNQTSDCSVMSIPNFNLTWVFDNGNINWCKHGRAFLVRTGHFCVEQCILLSNWVFWCQTSVITRTTRTPAFWGYPPTPHDYPYYWPVHFESQVHTIDQ